MAEKHKWPIILNLTIKPLEERHFVTLAIFMLAAGMLMMARENPDLWEVDLFTIILQAVVISGIIGAILAFHFAANKADEKKVDNTAKAFDALKAATKRDETRDAVDAARDVADAAREKAEDIAVGAPDTGELPPGEKIA